MILFLKPPNAVTCPALQPGNVVEVVIPGVGRLAKRVAADPGPAYLSVSGRAKLRNFLSLITYL
ncbi:MAG: hypothetical protein AB1523_03405 [Bacillota bacterium]